MAPPCVPDAGLFQHGVEHLKWASAIDHETFRDDLATNPPSSFFSEVPAIMRDAQVDADSKVGLTVEGIAAGHLEMREPGIETRPLQEFPVRLFVLAAVSGATAFAFAGVFALQPASLVLQPPWPLQTFCPLHACTPLSAMVWRETPAWVGAFAA